MKKGNIWRIGLITLGIIVLGSLAAVGIGSTTFKTDFNAIARNVLSKSEIKKSCGH